MFSAGILSYPLLRIFWGEDNSRNEFVLNVLTEIGLLCLLPNAGNKVQPPAPQSQGVYFVPASIVYGEFPALQVDLDGTDVDDTALEGTVDVGRCDSNGETYYQ